MLPNGSALSTTTLRMEVSGDLGGLKPFELQYLMPTSRPLETARERM